jgi:uncharacterized protein (TIGR04255 family)
MTMSGAPDFVEPPIVELVLGAQFSPLTKLTSGHFGLFWKELGEDWVEPSDGPPIEDQFELFDRPRWSRPVALALRLEPVRLPGRFMVWHRAKDRRLQLQSTRFHLNWRKQNRFYPSYRHLISEFEEMFGRFTAFAERVGLGPVAVNQWELTYIDAFQQGEYWQTPADWSVFLPGLFGSLRAADGLRLEHRAAEWTYEIVPKRGRLHVAAQPGRAGDGQEAALLLQMTSRGPVGDGGAETLRAGLDIGHEIAVETFLRVTSEDAKKRWGAKV